jgi:Ca2+-binding EF-hand superfamily protein
MSKKPAKQSDKKTVKSFIAKSLSAKDLQNLAKQTFFSKAETHQKYNLFKAFAVNNLLDQNGFIKFYTAVRFETSLYLEKISIVIFKSLSRNTIGGLSFSDVMQFYSLTVRGEMHRKLELAFNLYDLDNKGSINRNDVYRVLSAMLDLLDAEDKHDATEYTEECMLVLDSSRSGRISKSNLST